MQFTVENIEFYLLILVRISAFVFTAPIFSATSIPRSVQAGISGFLTIVVASTIDYSPLTYNTVYEMAGLIILELLTGLIIGFFANICIHIINFAGHMIDTEIGFSMASIFDPASSMQVTISASLFSYFVMLLMLISGLHHYLIRAIIETFQVIPIGGAKLAPDFYLVMLQFITDMFIIGFRIILPIFASILVVNVVLAILAKVSPQMNMFVVGFQLKILIGLIMFLVLATLLPGIGSFIFDEIRLMVQTVVARLSGA